MATMKDLEEIKVRQQEIADGIKGAEKEAEVLRAKEKLARMYGVDGTAFAAETGISAVRTEVDGPVVDTQPRPFYQYFGAPGAGSRAEEVATDIYGRLKDAGLVKDSELEEFKKKKGDIVGFVGLTMNEMTIGTKATDKTRSDLTAVLDGVGIKANIVEMDDPLAVAGTKEKTLMISETGVPLKDFIENLPEEQLKKTAALVEKAVDLSAETDLSKGYAKEVRATEKEITKLGKDKSNVDIRVVNTEAEVKGDLLETVKTDAAAKLAAEIEKALKNKTELPSHINVLTDIKNAKETFAGTRPIYQAERDDKGNIVPDKGSLVVLRTDAAKPLGEMTDKDVALTGKFTTVDEARKDLSVKTTALLEKLGKKDDFQAAVLADKDIAKVKGATPEETIALKENMVIEKAIATIQVGRDEGAKRELRATLRESGLSFDMNSDGKVTLIPRQPMVEFLASKDVSVLQEMVDDLKVGRPGREKEAAEKSATAAKNLEAEKKSDARVEAAVDKVEAMIGAVERSYKPISAILGGADATRIGGEVAQSVDEAGKEAGAKNWGLRDYITFGRSPSAKRQEAEAEARVDKIVESASGLDKNAMSMMGAALEKSGLSDKEVGAALGQLNTGQAARIVAGMTEEKQLAVLDAMPAEKRDQTLDATVRIQENFKDEHVAHGVGAGIGTMYKSGELKTSKEVSEVLTNLVSPDGLLAGEGKALADVVKGIVAEVKPRGRASDAEAGILFEASLNGADKKVIGDALAELGGDVKKRFDEIAAERAEAKPAPVKSASKKPSPAIDAEAPAKDEKFSKLVEFLKENGITSKDLAAVGAELAAAERGKAAGAGRGA